MAWLESLAQGMRGAGGILDANVYQEGLRDERLKEVEISRRRDLIAQQVIRGAEAGAIAPEAAKQTLGKLGYGDIPVGLSLQAQQQQEQVRARQEEAQRRAQLTNAFRTLDPEDRQNPAMIADVFFQHGFEKEGAGMVDRAVQRQDVNQRHLADLQRRYDDMDRQARRDDINDATRKQIAQDQNALRLQIAQGQQQVARESHALRRATERQASRLVWEGGVNAEGNQVRIGRDPHTGEEKVRTDTGLKPISVFNAGEIDERQARNALETRVKPHQTVMDNFAKYTAARASGDTAQTNLALGQLVQQMSRVGSQRFKGELDSMLGSNFRGGSLDERIGNFVSQLATGTVSNDLLKKLDTLARSQTNASLDRIHEEMMTESEKLKAQKKDPAKVIAPRIYGDVVIWPDVGARRYKTTAERDAALKAYEEERSGR